ncbi:MAG: ABC transporter ATP-binding protein [Candidatus Pacebacteria bacterium]|nr:ABC transporter ATP-binding protein [Candidatus Paceibacterota bacterium]
MIKKKYSTKDTVRNLKIALSPWKKQIFIGLFLFFLSSLISSFVPFIYGTATDAIFSDSDFKKAGILIFVWIFISLFRTGLVYFGSRVRGKIFIESSNFNVLSLYFHSVSLPMSFHKNKKMGSLSRRISDGIFRGLENFVKTILFSFFPNLFLFISASVILIFVEWRLALVLFSASLIYILIVVFYTRTITFLREKAHKAYEKAYGFCFDSLSNIHNIKITSNEKYEEKRLKKEFDKAEKKDLDLQKIWENLSAWQGAVSDFAFVAVFAFGIFLLSKGELSAGKLIMFVGYTNLLLSPLSGLTGEYRVFKETGVFLNRAMDLFKEKSENLSIGEDLDVLGNIEFKNVVFSYENNKKPVLDKINFKINQGEVVALVGKSGVGKTTIIDLIGGYYFPNRGEVLIDGFDTKKIKLNSLRSKIAVVPQEVSLFNDNILQNIKYANPTASEKEIIEASKASNADEFIGKFPKKYKQKVGERGIKLSTGQKQRVAIARALLRNPKILILDEATSALDSESERLVQEALSRLVKNRTTFVIAHRLSTIQNADKIIVLENGKIAEMGRHDDLMKNPSGIYRNFWELQSARKSV